MAIMIRERMDGGLFYKQLENASVETPINVEEANNISETVDPDSIMVDIEAIHAMPFATRNFTRYAPKCIKNSVPTWTKPYRRPLIKHHNEADGEIIGRVVDANYKTNDTLSGTPALMLTVNVPGDAKTDVKNGLLETTSIGAIAHDVRCSICGQQLADGHMCEHERGVTYKTDDGPKVCTWDVYEMEAKEISFVVVPSDIYSKKVAVYPATNATKKQQITESLDNSIRKGEEEMPEKNAVEPVKADELAEAKAQISELEKKISEFEESLKQEKAKADELDKSLKAAESKASEFEESNKALEAKIAKLTESVNKMTEDAKEESQLKESLENAVSEAKAQLKESLADTVQIIRKSLGRKEIAADEIKERTEESLRDAIKDLKEELSDLPKTAINVKESVDTLPKPNSVEDPTLKKDDEASNIAESSDKEKIDLKAGLATIFGGVMSAR